MKQFLSPFSMGVTLAVCMVVWSVGCAPQVTSKSLRHHMSPKLQSVALSREMRLNRAALANDVNQRQIWDDLDGIFFNDRPLRMSVYPIR